MNQWIIPGAITALGFIILLFFLSWKRNKQRGIRHYEEIRDKLTLRKLKPIKKVEEYIPSGGFDLQSFIVSIVIVGVTLVVGIYISDTIGSQMVAGSEAGVASAAVVESLSVVSSWIPVFLTISITIAILIMITKMISGSGGLANAIEDSGIGHYTGMRDRLTTREEESEDEDESEEDLEEETEE